MLAGRCCLPAGGWGVAYLLVNCNQPLQWQVNCSEPLSLHTLPNAQPRPGSMHDHQPAQMSHQTAGANVAPNIPPSPSSALPVCNHTSHTYSPTELSSHTVLQQLGGPQPESTHTMSPGLCVHRQSSPYQLAAGVPHTRVPCQSGSGAASCPSKATKPCVHHQPTSQSIRQSAMPSQLHTQPAPLTPHPGPNHCTAGAALNPDCRADHSQLLKDNTHPSAPPPFLVRPSESLNPSNIAGGIRCKHHSIFSQQCTTHVMHHTCQGSASQPTLSCTTHVRAAPSQPTKVCSCRRVWSCWPLSTAPC